MSQNTSAGLFESRFRFKGFVLVTEEFPANESVLIALILQSWPRHEIGQNMISKNEYEVALCTTVGVFLVLSSLWDRCGKLVCV